MFGDGLDIPPSVFGIPSGVTTVFGRVPLLGTGSCLGDSLSASNDSRSSSWMAIIMPAMAMRCGPGRHPDVGELYKELSAADSGYISYENRFMRRRSQPLRRKASDVGMTTETDLERHSLLPRRWNLQRFFQVDPVMAVWLFS